MMKRILYPLLGLVASFSVISCQDDTVAEPTVNVTLEKYTYTVGEIVEFHFEGDADFVTIFTGVDNYTGNGSNHKGSRYEYRERAHENGVSTLQFNCRKDGTAPTADQNVDLHVMLSTDFSGELTIDEIHKATWTDITDGETMKMPTDPAKFSDGTFKVKTNYTSKFDLSPYNDQPVYIAFKYVAKSGMGVQDGWTISSYTVKNQVETDDNVFTVVANGSGALFATISDLYDEETGFTKYNWSVGNNTVCKGGNGDEALESWVVATPIYPNTVTPDYGTKIKSYSEIVPKVYEYQYFKPGKFTATVVSRNATSFGEQTKVQNIELEILEKPTE